MECEHIYYTYVFFINLSLPLWLSSTIAVSKNKKWISNFLIPIQPTLFFYLGISIIITYCDWRYFPLMLVFLTKPIYIPSEGHDSYLKLLSGTLKYYISTKGDSEVSNLIYQEKVMNALWVSIYCTGHHTHFQCLEFFRSIGYCYYNLDMFSRWLINQLRMFK